MKPCRASDAPIPLQSTRLLDQVRERIRYLQCSLSTETTYAHWVKFFVRWHGRKGQMRHPREMGALGVEAFLTMLAVERNVSASTHNQALRAIFLYREVLAIKLPWLDSIGRPQQKRRIPIVLTQNEVTGLSAQMSGDAALLARLLYGTDRRSDVSTTMIYTHVLKVAGAVLPARWIRCRHYIFSSCSRNILLG